MGIFAPRRELLCLQASRWGSDPALEEKPRLLSSRKKIEPRPRRALPALSWISRKTSHTCSLHVSRGPQSPPQPRAGLQGCSIPCLPQSFLQTLQRDFSPPLLIILSLTTSAPPAPPTSPASLCSSCQATCVTRARGKKEKKRSSKTPWHASPDSIFGERSFFLSKQESHREK